jgi:hypothetical protein
MHMQLTVIQLVSVTRPWIQRSCCAGLCQVIVQQSWHPMLLCEPSRPVTSGDCRCVAGRRRVGRQGGTQGGAAAGHAAHRTPAGAKISFD